MIECEAQALPRLLLVDSIPLRSQTLNIRKTCVHFAWIWLPIKNTEV